jgi:hypothetical protein
MPSAISIVSYDTGASPTPSATITVSTDTNLGAFTMSNVP